MHMLITPEQLQKIVVKAGFVTPEEWDSALKNAIRRRRDVGDVLVERGILNTQYLYELIAESLKITFVDFKRERIDPSAIRLMSEELIAKLNALVFKKDKKGCHVALLHPDADTIATVEKTLKCRVIPHLTTKKSFMYALRSYQRDLAGELDAILEEFKLAHAQEKEGSTEYPIVTVVDTILAYAVMLGASDVHFEPLADALLVRMRIDGLLHDKLELPKDLLLSVVARIKILARLKIDEHLGPQDGRFIFMADDEDVFVRVSVIPTFYGEKVVMRILNEHEQRFNLEDSGMSEYNLELVNKEIRRSHGLILVVGPTGSGKTTSLYTLLNMLNTEEANLCTIEDPIEYGIARINQTQVNVQSGYTFASGLRSLLRQDPDVIMVGEIRDEETAEIAVHSSLTGHLVLSTLHTDNTISVLSRLADMGIKPFILASTLNMVIAQRLVRKICVDCIESYILSEKEIASLVSDYELDKVFLKAKQRGVIMQSVRRLQDLTLYRGKGCERCHTTGYAGRVGLFEVLTVNDVLRSHVIDQTKPDELVHIAMEQGMLTLVEDGWHKVLNGVTTLEELLGTIAS